MAEESTAPVTRNKPGQALGKMLDKQEERLKLQLAKVNARRQLARDRATGKMKAQAYCRKWLQALSDTELKKEAGLRGINYKDCETVEAIEEAILEIMFTPKLAEVLLDLDQLEEAVAMATNGEVEDED